MLFGIVNVTEDSFSDGGRFLDPKAARAHARALVEAGAHVIDLGAAASNVDAKPVSADEEIRRLDPVIAALQATARRCRSTAFCRMCSALRSRDEVDFLNDIQGFPDPSLYPGIGGCAIASSSSCTRCRAAAGRSGWNCSPAEVWDRIVAFFHRADCGARTSRHRPRAHHHRSRHGLLFEQPARSLASCAGPARRAEARLRAAGAGFGFAQILLAFDHRARFRRRGWSPRPWQPSFSPPSRVSIISVPTTRAVLPMRFGLHRRCA